MSSFNYLGLYQCKHGNLYLIHSRNLEITVYNENVQGFTGIRQKFDARYLFTEYHYDTGPPFGTAKPKDDLSECPVCNLLDAEQWESSDLLFKYLDFMETLYFEYQDLFMLKEFTGQELDRYIEREQNNAEFHST